MPVPALAEDAHMTFRLPALLLALALLAPSTAVAKKGPRDFGKTFNHASRLCAKAENGELPKRLQASAAQVKTACATLKKAHEDAAKAAAPGVETLRGAITAARDARKAACGETAAREDCRAARKESRTAVRDAKQAFRKTAKTYRETIRKARKAFWAEIKTLRGGSKLEADRDAPADSVVPGAPKTA